MCAESPASGARFVGWRFVAQDTFDVKDLLIKKIEKIIARNIDFGNNKNINWLKLHNLFVFAVNKLD